MKKTYAVIMAAACYAAQAVTVKPENTDEILVNPDMGLVMFHYSNRQWAYGRHAAPLPSAQGRTEPPLSYRQGRRHRIKS